MGATMSFQLASKRFTKTSFDTKSDWGSHPVTIYTCPSCSGETRLARADIESAVDQSTTPSRQELVNWFKDWCPYFPRDWFDAVCPFRCSACHRQVLLALQVSDHLGSGRHYWFTAVAEAIDDEPNAQSNGPLGSKVRRGSSDQAT